MIQTKTANKENGAALLFSLLTVMMISVVAITLLTEGHLNQMASQNTIKNSIDTNFAEASAQYAIKMFATDHNFSGTPNADTNQWINLGTKGGQIQIKKGTETVKGINKKVVFECNGRSSPTGKTQTVLITLETKTK